jgi:hypothetical protein
MLSTIDPGAGDNEYDQDAFQRLVQGRMETIIQKVINELPADLDYSAADTIFLYWTPEMYAFKQTVSRRNTVFQTPQGPIRISVQGGGTYHTTDTGSVTAEMKKEFAWSYFLHDIMHWQGMNGHAPGNGWKTGLVRELIRWALANIRVLLRPGKLSSLSGTKTPKFIAPISKH